MRLAGFTPSSPGPPGLVVPWRWQGRIQTYACNWCMSRDLPSHQLILRDMHVSKSDAVANIDGIVGKPALLASTTPPLGGEGRRRQTERQDPLLTFSVPLPPPSGSWAAHRQWSRCCPLVPAAALQGPSGRERALVAWLSCSWLYLLFDITPLLLMQSDTEMVSNRRVYLLGFFFFFFSCRMQQSHASGRSCNTGISS
ncbi:hypothetical protein B0I35DRAFT_199867 [Stachybotrys elegans]|uniref:Uncharacterized protein n=1 Tax=Stachybotrys elegans TaxID=80388 RepID=A0A8K0STT7_9HYPO|nr:hypothetical protein B0I35DRAFT_199867 [Stachybotrys elegans]